METKKGASQRQIHETVMGVIAVACPCFVGVS